MQTKQVKDSIHNIIDNLLDIVKLSAKDFADRFVDKANKAGCKCQEKPKDEKEKI
jgi:hypothetical protein